jgi:hypothetical protein
MKTVTAAMLKNAAPSCGNIIPPAKIAPCATGFMAQTMRLYLTNRGRSYASNAMQISLQAVVVGISGISWITMIPTRDALDSKSA